MISFVVPAHNESAHIRDCVTSIVRHVPAGEAYEIVVVDNRSTDDTAAIAQAAGATVVPSEARTIAAVRNEGVRAAHGDVLVLLDGDCILTADWRKGIADVLREVRATPLLLAGSHPIPPRDEHVFLWKHWFVPFLQQEGTSHIGSAHMILRREAYDHIGGFDERLVTGEDFDLCQRLQAAGGSVAVRLELLVEHHGYPRTWRDFVRRERWHGRGDVSSLRSFLASRVALLGLAFTLLVLGAVVALSTGHALTAAAVGVSALLIVVAASVARFRHAGLRAVVIAAGIFGVYFTARTLALLDAGRTGR